MLNLRRLYRGSTYRSATRVVIVATLLFTITACEAPLELEAVNVARQNPIQRTDRFQAAATNGNAAVVVGNQGVIVKTLDAGGSWQRHVLPNWPALIDIEACPNGNFVALAYDKKIYLSNDNGGTWLEKAIPTEETPQAITCTNNNELWVVGSFTFMWHSTDEGDSWKETTRDEDSIFTTVQFLDANIGYVTGEFGMVLKTIDGGATWENLAPLPNEFYPQAAYFLDPVTGWVIGLGGSILHTVDGGNTWAPQATQTHVPLYGIAELNGQMYVSGGEGVLLTLREDRWQPVEHSRALRLYLRALTGMGNKLLVGGVNGTLEIIELDSGA